MVVKEREASLFCLLGAVGEGAKLDHLEGGLGWHLVIF